MKNWLVCIIGSLSVCISCEDIIDIDLAEADTVLVVDGWINDLPETQSITLSLSQPYFENSSPPAVTDAKVKVTRNDGMVFNFTHIENGVYQWGAPNERLGAPGDQFQLEIDYDEVLYNASSEIRRVPAIDSIGLEFRENELLVDDGIYAQFYARDFGGSGDTYWIKTFKNGKYLEKSQELNIAYDAGFDAGTGIDGIVFIPPIRELVNALNEDLLPTPYVTGDEITVEIHSISIEAFNFLEIARDQINNGDNGIFSIPLANPRSNIIGGEVLGFFNVAAVSSETRNIE